MATTSNLYNDKGVQISKSSLSVGDEITILYNGILKESGADKVYAHIGYGDEWEEKDFIPMNFEDGTFKAVLKVTLPESLNLTFKDSANNWDNNDLKNYSFKVTAKKAKAVVDEKSSIKAVKESKTPAKTPAAKSTSKKAAEKKVKA